MHVYYLKELEKEEHTKPKVNRMKEIIKIREEVNKIEIKNRKKINGTRASFLKIKNRNKINGTKS